MTFAQNGNMHDTWPSLSPVPIDWERKARAEKARALIGPGLDLWSFPGCTFGEYVRLHFSFAIPTLLLQPDFRC